MSVKKSISGDASSAAPEPEIGSTLQQWPQNPPRSSIQQTSCSSKHHAVSSETLIFFSRYWCECIIFSSRYWCECMAEHSLANLCSFTEYSVSPPQCMRRRWSCGQLLVCRYSVWLVITVVWDQHWEIKRIIPQGQVNYAEQRAR